MSKGGIINLRVEQSANNILEDEHVKIFAPAWVEQALNKLFPEFENAVFNIPALGNQITIRERITLTQLVAMARSEQVNTSGIIKFNQYNGISEQAIIALRDLVKHCVIIGKDKATHFGGYPSGQPQPLNQDIILCDLPGLQFQELYNTGRHVLISENDTLPKGLLDDDIFQQTVGEQKQSFAQAQADQSGRFIQGQFKNQSVLLDTKAFQNFITQDFILTAKALNAQAQSLRIAQGLNFKFLKYGTGFFAESLRGEAKTQLNLHLTLGVLRGIQELFACDSSQRALIKRIELPFFNASNPAPVSAEITAVLKEIENLCERYGVECSYDNQDALKQTSAFMTATTNCSDPHAPTGNEMHYGSVDAAIAENLENKGHQFNPVCNPQMAQQFLSLPEYNRSPIRQPAQNLYPHSVLKPLLLIGATAALICAILVGLQYSLLFSMVAAGLTSGALLVANRIYKSLTRSNGPESRPATNGPVNPAFVSQLEFFMGAGPNPHQEVTGLLSNNIHSLLTQFTRAILPATAPESADTLPPPSQYPSPN